jgi:hypothetical protein
LKVKILRKYTCDLTGAGVNQAAGRQLAIAGMDRAATAIGENSKNINTVQDRGPLVEKYVCVTY